MDGTRERALHAGAEARGQVPAGTDLVEWYYESGFTDGLPVVPPTPEKVAAAVAALGGDPTHEECRVAPRWGVLTREVLAINMVMAGCLPEYAPVVRAAMLALTDRAFNLNGVQATTHVAAPLVIVNGPLAAQIGMNGGCNAFGSGNRANATIGRAIRLMMLNVGGGWPADLDKCTIGNPAKYSYCVCENEAQSPFAPYHVEQGYAPEASTVFAMAAEAPHSVTDHQCDEHHRQQQRRARRALRGGAGAGTRARHRPRGLEPQRHTPLSVDAQRQRLPAHQPRPPLRPVLQPQPAEMGEARAGQPHPDRAQPRQHPCLRDGRRGRALFPVHPGLGPHEHAGAARGRGRGARRHLHRRHLRAVREEPAMLTVYDPRGALDHRVNPTAPRPRALAGLRLGILDNSKWNANKLLRASLAGLSALHDFAATNTYVKHSFSKDAAPELIERIAAECDLVLTAIGDCGSCCSCCVRDGIALEGRGVASAVIITTEFLRETRLTRAALGMPGLVPVVVDHPISSITEAEMAARAAQVVAQAQQVWLGA